MAELKLGTQIGGNLVWHQGILDLNPVDDKLFFRQFDVITDIGGQTINGGLSLKGDVDTTGRMVGVGANGGWGSASRGAFSQIIENDFNAHWLLTSNRKDGSGRAGIQVLTSNTGIMRLYTDNITKYVDIAGGQVSVQATMPSSASHLTRKDYVDAEVKRSMDYTDSKDAASNATVAALDTRVTTLDAQNVKITGNQSIAGIKTFSSHITVPAADPTAATQAAHKGYVDKLNATSVKGVTAISPVISTGGINPVISIAPASRASSGSMSSNDKIKLDDLPADALSRAGGTMKPNGFIKLDGMGGINSITGGKEYSIFRDHNNGNVTVGGAGGDLYLGYTTDSEAYTTQNVLLYAPLKWMNNNTGRVLVDSDGFIPWASIKDRIGLEGKTKKISGPTNFDEYEGLGFYNLYAVRPTTGTLSVNPPPFDYGTMVVVGSGKDLQNFVTQIATERTNGATYIRTRNDGTMTWTTWNKQYSEKSKPTPADVGAAAVVNSKIVIPANSGALGATLKSQKEGSNETDQVTWLTDKPDNVAWHKAIGIRTSTGPVYWNGTGARRIYNEDFKPTAADVGALPVNANAVSATKLLTARTINGTNFDGSGNITTANWGTARTLTIGDAAKSVNGAGNVSWSLSEIGAYHPGNKPSLGSDLGLQWQLPNPGGTSRYVRLVTLGLTDKDITFVLAGFGDNGTTKRATYNVTAATRGSGISVDVNALDVDLLYGEKPIIYHRRVGESFEVWVKTPIWGLDATFTRMSGRGGVVNIDSSTTIEPTGLTAVTINQIYTTRFKPTAGDVGAVNKTGDTMTGNLTASKVLVSGAQGSEGNALTRKDYVDTELSRKLSLTGGKVTGPITSLATDNFRIASGSIGTFWRKDDSRLYLMLTAAGDPEGTYNNLRPFHVSLTDGSVVTETKLLLPAGQAQQADAATRKDYVDGQVATRAPMAHTHTVSAITDLNAQNATATANTLALRDSEADVHARLLRTTYGDEFTMSGAIAFRVNNSTNNYTRYCNDPASVRNWMKGAKTDWQMGWRAYIEHTDNPMTEYHIPGKTAVLTYLTGDGVYRIDSSNGGGGAVGARMSLDSSGNLYVVGNGNFNDVQIRSDRRLKKNFVKISGALDKVSQLCAYTYDKKQSLSSNDYSTHEVGLIAQDVQLVLPEAVTEVVNPVDNLKVLTISNSGVNALLVEAIKELRAEVNQLRQQIAK